MNARGDDISDLKTRVRLSDYVGRKVTVIAPEPAKFAQSRGQISRTIGKAWQQAQRFS